MDHFRFYLGCLYVSAILLSGQLFAKEADLLFQSHEVFEVTLRAPFKDIKKQNTKSLKFDGTLSYLDNENNDIKVTIEVRGHNRRKKSICKFPPLKIRFDKSTTKHTAFEKQKSLKLVTQCDPYRNEYTGYLMKEYLAYRILNIVTPQSFNVRLLKINYSEGKSSLSKFAFFIENKKRLAKRLDAQLQAEETSAVHLNSVHLNQVSLFQLLIGNVDWSATSGHGDECCHNFKLFERGGDDILAIPYDFDYSGLVNAKYAVPNKKMRLNSIKERRYRGYCRNNDYLTDNIKLFNQKKPEIMSLLAQFSHLTKRERKSTERYVESFYRIINDPARVTRVIRGFCHESQFQEVAETNLTLVKTGH